MTYVKHDLTGQHLARKGWENDNLRRQRHFREIDESNGNLIMKLVTSIIKSYVANNFVPPKEIGELVNVIVTALEACQCDRKDVTQQIKLIPAVNPTQSVTGDYIVCLEDGQKLKMLKRHISSKYGLTPEAYRSRWNLPANYPMVAANYARQRSEIARRIKNTKSVDA